MNMVVLDLDFLGMELININQSLKFCFLWYFTIDVLWPLRYQMATYIKITGVANIGSICPMQDQD